MNKRTLQSHPAGRDSHRRFLCAFVAALFGLFAGASIHAAASADEGSSVDEASPTSDVTVQQIGWIGVMQPDMARAERFFGELLELDEYGRMDDMGLVIYQLPSGQIFELLAEQAPDAAMFKRPVLGFLVGNVAQAKVAMEGRGLAFSSAVVEVPGSAWAFFQDPQGYTHEIAQNPEPRLFDQSEKQLRIKSIGSVAMPAEDHQATAEFFRTSLALTAKPMGSNLPFTLFEFANGTFFEVRAADQAKTKDYPLVAFEIDDAEAARRLLMERGLEVSEITGMPAAQWFDFEGPEGVLYEIISFDRSKL